MDLTAADSGRTVASRVGQRITVRLAGNPTTDYSWSVASLKGSAVRQEGKLTFSPPGPGAMDGAGGVYTATFKAVRNGRAALTMEYKKDAKPARTFTLTIAVGARPSTAVSKKAATLVRLFKADIARFTLDIRYFGPKDKPYNQLALCAGKMKDRHSRSWPAAQLTANAARKVIDHLAADGFFDRAKNITLATVEMPKGPAYTLMVSGANGQQFYESIGWDPKMLARLDALAEVLDGDAAKKMPLLLSRLSGLRKKWQEDAAKGAKGKRKRKRNAQLRGVTVP